MPRFTNKIEIIEAVRIFAQQVRAVQDTNSSGQEITRICFNGGLNEAKDLVEAIMAYGVQQFQVENQKKIDDVIVCLKTLQAQLYI